MSYKSLFKIMNISLRLLLIAFSVIVAAYSQTTFAAETKPNVLLILADDWGWGDFGFMGHAEVRTPHLDRLSKEGVTFTNGYVPCSLCRPSLATILTGLYPHQHQICFNDPPDGVDRDTIRYLEKLPTIPRLLSANGYRSLQTGKFWEGHHANGGFTDGMTTKGRHGDEGLTIGRQTLQPIYDFLNQKTEQPYFIWYAPMMPHVPHNPPERLVKKYQKPDRDPGVAKYYAMCEWTDETVGELLGWMDQNKKLENTLVIFLFDNGWIQPVGEEAKNNGAKGAARSKNTPYEGGVRAPLIFKWPGKLPVSKRAELVSSIDLAPTILSACGVKVPETMPGVNLLDVAAGKQELKRDAVYGEVFVHTAIKLDAPAANLTARWLRSGDWKLIVLQKAGAKPELFNVQDDPAEQKELSATNGEKVAELRKKMDAVWAGKER